MRAQDGKACARRYEHGVPARADVARSSQTILRRDAAEGVRARTDGQVFAGSCDAYRGVPRQVDGRERLLEPATVG